jgi:hypothetical protein
MNSCPYCLYLLPSMRGNVRYLIVVMMNIYEFCENQGSKDRIFLDINEITVMHVV